MNKCARCNVIYDSKVDLSLRIIYGLQKNWIGCDVVDPCPCDYGTHAVGITVTKSKTKRKKNEFISPPFKSPRHSKT